MKKFLLSSFIAAAAAVPALAGVENINYQAVIKNGSEVVADKKVAIKFDFLDKAEKVVYTEIQYPTTNAAGYVSCQLGQDKDLSEVDWTDLTLAVSVDLGNGYQALSSEAVSSVPSALYALRSADSDEIKEAVEELMQDTELNKETILGINAEIVKLNGIADGLDETYASKNDVDAFATMLEERIDKIEASAAATDKDFKNLDENLTNAFTGVDAKFEEIEGQLENLNNVSAVVRANEEAIEELQDNF